MDINRLKTELKKRIDIEAAKEDCCDEDGFGDGEFCYEDGRSQGRFEAFREVLSLISEKVL